MHFTPNREDPLVNSVRDLLEGLGLSLVEFAVARHKTSVQIHVVLYKAQAIGVADCSKAHRAIQPRLELAFPGQDVYLEVASPGVDRNFKDASEFSLYVGRGVRCYRTDITEWTAGVVESADEKSVVLKGDRETVTIPYGIIAKAKFDYSQEVED